MGGRPAGTTSADISYVTMATLGNSVSFGSLGNRYRFAAGTSDKIRAMRVAGYNDDASAASDSIEYFSIATGGDTVDFGDLASAATFSLGACSNGHGGL